MPSPTLQETRLAEVRLCRRAELLRGQLYALPDPDANPDLRAALAQAEADLARLRADLRAAQAAAGGGLLLTTESAARPGGSIMGAATTGIDAQVSLRMAYVPTGMIHLLDPAEHPLVTFDLKYTGDEYVRLRLTSSVEGYSAQAVSTVELLAGPDASAKIQHLPTFFPDRLQTVTELTRATLHIRIDDLDHQTEQESTFPIWLLARSSANNGYTDPATGRWVDLSHYYAAWVTPNAPDVLQLLRRAADLHPGRTIVGYQGKQDAGVAAAQVRAMFDALKAEQLLYINSVISFGAEGGASMQRLRLPRESLATRSANCADGAVLMASLLEAASLNPALVFVPGHAFLAWQTWEGLDDWDYLETTMISTSDFEAARQSARGQAKYWEAQAKSRNDPYVFMRLPLNELRSRGITPME